MYFAQFGGEDEGCDRASWRHVKTQRGPGAERKTYLPAVKEEFGPVSSEDGKGKEQGCACGDTARLET